MDHAEIWEQAKQLLREEVPSISYNTWIEQPLHPVYFEDGTLALEVTNDLYEQTIRSRYLQMIAEAVSRVAGQETKVRLMSIQERRAYQQQQGASYGEHCRQCMHQLEAVGIALVEIDACYA